MVHNKILMYHSVGGLTCSEAGAKLYCVSLKNFKEQMRYISKIKEQTKSYELRVMSLITFDDGLTDNYTNAFPVLKEYDLKAYFFIIVGKVDSDGYMNWEQIAQLRNAGMVIGSHGMTHRILTELNDKELDYELKESKMIIEDKLRQAIEYFSIPRGFCNCKIIDKLKKAGYTGVFTSNQKDNDGFRFGRIPVKAGWDLDYFIKALKGSFSLKDKAGELIKNSSKRILGAKNYDKIRGKILI